MSNNPGQESPDNKAIRELRDSVKEFNIKTSYQTEKMIKLTEFIAVLTVVMIIGLIIQIYLTKIQVSPILYEQQRNERQAYEFCRQYPEGDWPSASGGSISCTEVLKILKGKFE